MRQTKWLVPLITASVALAVQAQSRSDTLDPSGVARLIADSGGTAQVSIHSATGAARFVRAAPGGTLGVRVFGRSLSDDARRNRATQFLNNYRTLFGLTSVTTELAEPRADRDQQGAMHLTYKQVYQGLPVFGGELKAHFDTTGQLTVVNGTFVPGISLDVTPTRSAVDATDAAIRIVVGDSARKSNRLTAKPTLLIYREGLAQGVSGANHLAWQVEVTNKADVREFIYLDAHTGKLIDRVTGIQDFKNRRAFDGTGVTQPGPNYPNSPFWVEGAPFPTGNAEADNMIQASSEIYDLFKNAFGRDSYDGAGARMDSIFNRGDGCPNASWGGAYISFCPGTTTDDITAHEWGHAYTQYTDNLIYQWQPGALNEAYSDIWGETVDRINGRGTDTPDNPRTLACTVFTPNPATVTITAPAAIAGPKLTGSASFGPQTFSVSGALAGVDIGSTSAGCNALPVNSLAGKIAFIDRGTCGFSVKAQNAEGAGAIAVILGNNQGGTAVLNPGPTAGTTNNIPTLLVTQNDGTAIKAQLATASVTASLVGGGTGSDNSVRWLLGEDSKAFGGAIRDMYNPTCYGNPGKVSDAQYTCSAASDGGGVHNNSGVANHGYALLVDGGTYNGQTMSGIGLTKAAHIYWRAQSVYQGPASGFPDHADALQQSCTDLVGANLNGLTTGTPSGEVISATDCAQVSKVAAAVEFRSAPAQCAFQPLLAQSPPAACDAGTTQTNLLSDGFDGGKRVGARWQLSHSGTADYTARDWGVVNNLPGGRAGYAMYAVDYKGGTCSPGGNESGVMRLESPEIVIPAGAPTKLSFDHWVSTEAGYDGGNVKISVNGGAWTLVKGADFIYNAYNTTLAVADLNNLNPLAGEPAFSGSDGGSVFGSWGRSIVNLAPYAVANDKVKLRFEMGNDGCGGTFGWYLDDVKVYSCRP